MAMVTMGVVMMVMMIMIVVMMPMFISVDRTQHHFEAMMVSGMWPKNVQSLAQERNRAVNGKKRQFRKFSDREIHGTTGHSMAEHISATSEFRRFKANPTSLRMVNFS